MSIDERVNKMGGKARKAVMMLKIKELAKKIYNNFKETINSSLFGNDCELSGTVYNNGKIEFKSNDGDITSFCIDFIKEPIVICISQSGDNVTFLKRSDRSLKESMELKELICLERELKSMAGGNRDEKRRMAKNEC